MVFVGLLFFSFFASYFMTLLALKYATKTGLLDHPGKRSSHNISTPRGGGISIVIIFIISIVFIWSSASDTQDQLILGIVFGGLLVAGIGFWDDHHHIPAKWRFLVHLIASVLALAFITELPDIPFFSFKIELSIFGTLFYAIVLIWLLNLYNFMDGIDGIASIEAITVLLGATLILVLQDNFDSTKLLLLLAACVTGFLAWNWPPAKIFMGDASSGFLGFTIGLMAISISSTEQLNINLWSWLILLAVFIVDSTYTLLRRITNGDKWYEAHRSHAYQILARKYNSHKKVTLLVLLINSIWLFPLAYLASIYEYWAPVLTLITILPLIYITHKVEAGIKNN